MNSNLHMSPKLAAKTGGIACSPHADEALPGLIVFEDRRTTKGRRQTPFANDTSVAVNGDDAV